MELESIPALLLEPLQEVPALVQLPPLLTQVHQQLLQERPVTGLRGREGGMGGREGGREREEVRVGGGGR